MPQHPLPAGELGGDLTKGEPAWRIHSYRLFDGGARVVLPGEDVLREDPGPLFALLAVGKDDLDPPDLDLPVAQSIGYVFDGATGNKSQGQSIGAAAVWPRQAMSGKMRVPFLQASS